MTTTNRTYARRTYIQTYSCYATLLHTHCTIFMTRPCPQPYNNTKYYCLLQIKSLYSSLQHPAALSPMPVTTATTVANVATYTVSVGPILKDNPAPGPPTPLRIPGSVPVSMLVDAEEDPQKEGHTPQPEQSQGSHPKQPPHTKTWVTVVGVDVGVSALQPSSNKSTTNSSAKKSGYQASSAAVHKCVHCGKLLTTKGNMIKHVKTVHEKVKNHQCHLCGSKFHQAFNLQRHVQRNHDTK